MSAPEGGQPGFKRLNFFKGLVTYFTDWIDNEAYRRDKSRWHNQRLHGPGVVVGYTGEMLVTGRGDLSIEVQPGCAIDGSGNDLILWDTQIKAVHTDALKLPQTVYVVARYTEELTDFISYKQNLAVRGHRRVLEGCQIEITPLLPNVNKEIEIARILLDKDVKTLRDATDPQAPKPNEIDLRFVLRAGRAGPGIDRAMQLALQSMLTGARGSLGLMARAGRLETAQDALHQAIGMTAVHLAELIDARSALDLFAVLFELQVAIYVEIKLGHTQLTKLPQWDEWVGQLRVLQKTLGERSPAGSRLTLLINTQHRINDLVRVMFQAAPTAMAKV
ncbi:MAG: hypothetical protein JWN44_2859 [Myxococcales bacterium]|nr:hypothetical protein [Myxococcales bacterium]